MEVYIAGGVNGNIKADFKSSINSDTPQLINGISKVKLNILESFYYIDEVVTKNIPYFENFLLDSGAFTFFTKSQGVNWYEYIEKYAAYINDNKIKLFFELDIDSVVGYDEVLKLRKKLEKLTGRQCIPVWHKSRGKENFVRMCQEYPYVAIGGIVSKEIVREEYKYLPLFINTAHKYGAKIHGLGFTNPNDLVSCHFDSVDSSVWTHGNRFGYIYVFTGKTMVKQKVPDGYKLKAIEAARQNFYEWVKFSWYAEKNL